eukprot:3939417-Rhodomonas_salina.1
MQLLGGKIEPDLENLLSRIEDVDNIILRHLNETEYNIQHMQYDITNTTSVWVLVSHIENLKVDIEYMSRGLSAVLAEFQSTHFGVLLIQDVIHNDLAHIHSIDSLQPQIETIQSQITEAKHMAQNIVKNAGTFHSMTLAALFLDPAHTIPITHVYIQRQLAIPPNRMLAAAQYNFLQTIGIRPGEHRARSSEPTTLEQATELLHTALDLLERVRQQTSTLREICRMID